MQPQPQFPRFGEKVNLLPAGLRSKRSRDQLRGFRHAAVGRIVSPQFDLAYVADAHPLRVSRAEAETWVHGVRLLQARMRRQPNLEAPLSIWPVAEQPLSHSADCVGVDITVSAV